MVIEGESREVIKIMWSLLAMTIVVVALRAYTRIFVVHSYGLDDNVYNLAFVSNHVSLQTIFRSCYTILPSC